MKKIGLKFGPYTGLNLNALIQEKPKETLESVHESYNSAHIDALLMTDDKQTEYMNIIR